MVFFFNSWLDLVRVIVVGTLGYIALIFFLRVSGKRTLSKMNAFDMVITIAIGSVLGSLLLQKSVAVAEGIIAISVLIFLQFIITWSAVRSPLIRRLTRSEPSLIFYDGKFLDRQLIAKRVTRDDVLEAIRTAGVASISEVGSIVLETTGELSILKKVDLKSGRSALSNVKNIGID